MSKFVQIGIAAVVWMTCGVVRAEQAALTVLDSAGDHVGTIVGTRAGNGRVVINLKPTGRLAVMDIAYQTLGAVTYEYFTTRDCSGPIYLYTYTLGDGGIIEAYLDLDDQNSIIYPDFGAERAELNSLRIPGTFGCGLSKQQLMGYPVLRASVAEQRFKPPFTVKLQ